MYRETDTEETSLAATVGWGGISGGVIPLDVASGVDDESTRVSVYLAWAFHH